MKEHLFCRQSWLQRLIPRALQPEHADLGPVASADLQQLQAALQWESHHQYVNTKASNQPFTSTLQLKLPSLQLMSVWPPASNSRSSVSACAQLLISFKTIVSVHVGTAAHILNLCSHQSTPTSESATDALAEVCMREAAERFV